MALNDNRQQQQLQQYVDLFLRNKWLITLPFILITLGSVIVALAIPNIYKASTTILVVPQKVPENYVRSTVPAAVADRLQTLNQQIMSRTRLQQVIERYNLYREEAKKMAPEEIIELMRKKIDLSVNQRSRNGVNSFSLSFQNHDPRIAMQVANGLASLYIEENLKLRERRAKETADFLDRELAKLEKKLSKKEQLLSAFKQKYMGELPDQQDANLRMLDRLETQYQTSSAALAAAKDRQIQLQQQLNQLPTSSDTVMVEGHAVAVDPDAVRLEKMKNYLSFLRSRYTEAHPDVISLVAKIKKLEKELATKKKAESANGGVQEAVQPPRSPASVEISNQMTAVKQEIAQLQHELKRLRSEIDAVNAKVEAAPKREAELVALTRDYSNLHQNYQKLLDRKIEAQLAENLEMQQQGEQFKILDPAQLPIKPFKPDRRKILLAGMVLGLGIGVGLALLLDFLGKSYRYVPDIEKDLGLPVLVTIPRILTGKELQWRKIKNVGGLLVVFIALLVAGGLGYMYFKLTFSLPGWFQQTFFHL